tara:strand:- start:818 stop:1015 length:198 start_codon:yes stop_codon:yes gene_type:complete
MTKKTTIDDLIEEMKFTNTNVSAIDTYLSNQALIKLYDKLKREGRIKKDGAASRRATALRLKKHI